MMRRSRAFSLVEFMVAMVVMSLIGGTAITSLWVFWSSYMTDRDYVEAREEIEFAFQIIGRDMTNISLGMPNNRSSAGDFAESFRGDGDDKSPIMFFMGKNNERWGGPITLRWHPGGGPDYLDSGVLKHAVTSTVVYGDNDVYIGDELIYATAIPAVVGSGSSRSVLKVGNTRIGVFENSNTQINFPLLQSSGVTALMNYTDDGRSAGIVAGNTTQRSTRSWIVLPGLQIPLLVDAWDASSNSLTLRVAPYSTKGHTGALGGFEEIYLVKVARVFVNSRNQLVQEIYGNDFNDTPAAETATSSTVRYLAENIVGVVFIHSPSGQALTMHIAAMGANPHPESGAAGVQPAGWPVVSGDNRTVLSGDILKRRIVTGSRTWRIRN